MRKFFSKLSVRRLKTHSHLLKRAFEQSNILLHLSFLEENLKFESELASSRLKLVRCIINDLESL